MEIASSSKLINRSFASDNNSGAIPEALEALGVVNKNHVAAYGNDPITEEARTLFKAEFGQDSEVFFTFNGTGANILALAPMLRSFDAVICAESSHLQLDECGALEKLVGSKLLLVPSPNGKITPEGIQEKLVRRGDPHHVQVRAVSVTQPTELGTLYTIEELKDISDVCKKNGLFFHIDGSRLPLAAVALDCSLKNLTADVGCDAVSVGGAKNGLINAEAVVFFKRELAKLAPFHQKQLLQLAGKMRFTSAQFIAFLKDQTWRRYAENSIDMAIRLEKGLQEIPQIKITQKREVNSVFAIVPKQSLHKMREKYFFYVWDELTCEVRWMCTFDTQPDDVDGFLEEIRNSI